VIMVTILDEQRRGMALGAIGYLTKPIDRERLNGRPFKSVPKIGSKKNLVKTLTEKIEQKSSKINT
jgi:PleD family two-component response regulator